MMFKMTLLGLGIAACLGASIPTSEAREIDVWGHSFTVDDPPAPVAAPAPQFKALVTHPERLRHKRRPLSDDQYER